MKKIISLIMTVITLAVVLMSSALADEGTWFCTNCGTRLDTEFCPDCGTRRPDNAEALSAEKWPEMELSGTGTGLAPLESESERHQAYFGPNNQVGAGAYKPYKVTGAKALFREGDYILTDLSYQTVEKRCVYFKASSLTNTSVESVNLTAYPATVKSAVQPQYGPGSEYASVTENVENKKTGKITTYRVTVDAGTDISVFFETNGWVFAEFNCSLGTIRAWLPANTVW